MNKLPRTVFRPLDGILLLDKPPGLSSNQALQRVRHLFRAEKAGHTGSLDPLATGLLPVCFGEATKIAGQPARQRQGLRDRRPPRRHHRYRRRRRPAAARAPGADARPATRSTRPCSRFIGRIRQRPPIYSALKQGGEPLYAKARRGEADRGARARSRGPFDRASGLRSAIRTQRLRVDLRIGHLHPQHRPRPGRSAGLWRPCGVPAAPVGRAVHASRGCSRWRS